MKEQNLIKLSIRKDRIAKFQYTLIAWYKIHGREFPWRKNQNDYQVIISEILLQKTKADTVAKYYKQFLDKYPNWQSIISEDLNNLEQTLKPLGLYHQRALRLKRLCNEMQRRRFILPKSRKELEGLPFFGQYISNAVELHCNNLPRPLLDINMARLLERYFGKRTKSDIRYDPYLQNLAHMVVNHKDTVLINWAIIDFASIVCKARKPLCIRCILKSKCKYYEVL